jgi:hypothetical protein
MMHTYPHPGEALREDVLPDLGPSVTASAQLGATAISTAIGGEPFDLRDIRRTTETMLAGMGISQLLSHGLSGVQAAHYDRHGYTDEKRAALVAWEARLEEIQTGKHTSNVVTLRGKQRTREVDVSTACRTLP